MQSRPRSNRFKGAAHRAVLESLENRRLLSAVANPVAKPTDGPLPTGSASSTPKGYSPAQINGAYGISSINFGSVTGNGAGQTIAIIGAFDDPNLVSSTNSSFDSSDLHNFDTAMGLADPPSFIKVDENGGSSYPDAATGDNAGWANESALDVEWTHAIAPEANIILVECYSANISDLIQGAMQYITTVPGVSVVNMSFSVSEFADESQYDDSLVTPNGHQGITVLAASGDNGSGTLYPSASPDVVSVGSTTLNVSGNTYSSETGAPDSGGGLSQYESKPSFQSNISISSTARATPDVSIDGNPNTGLSVYDSYDGGSSTPWYKVGGSSAATVLWSGLMAITDQGRIADGDTTLSGPTQTLPALYQLSSSDFHDITSGSNGEYSSTAGFDLVTGLGTPIANKLSPALASANVDVATNNTPAKLAFAVQPSNASTGKDISPDIVVDVENSSGQIVTTDGSLVTLAVNGGAMSLDGTTTVLAVNGVATFSDISIPTNGTYKLVVSDGDLPASTSASFNVSTAAVVTPVATKLAVGVQPTTVTAGSVIGPAITVDVLDASGNLLTTDNSFVTLSIASGPAGATLGGVVKVNAIGGVATFSDVTVSTAGTVILAATDGSLISANSSSFTVNAVVVPPPTSKQLVFTQQPVPTVAGTALGSAIVVHLVDSTGTLVTTDDSAVTLSIAAGPTGATLGGTLTVSAVDGVATFTGIVPSTDGTFVLTATDNSLTAATSAAFAVTPAGTLQPSILKTNLPVAVVAGAKLRGSVVVQLTNIAANLSSGTVTTDIYATAASGAQTLLGSVTSKLKVAANKTAKITVPVSLIPAALDGSYTLQAVTQDTSGNPSSSAAAATAFTAAAPFIALKPAVTKLTLPAAVVGGSKTNASAVVKVSNTGNIPSAGTTTVGIYASPDGLAGDAILIASVTKKVTIKSGSSANVAFPLKLIPASLNGTYTILAEVTDPDSAVTSTATGTTVDVAPPFVSINISSAAVSATTITSGKSATLTLSLENTGNIPATGQARIDIGLSTNGKTQSVDITSLLKAITLPVGKPVVLHLKFTIPDTTAAGTYFPFVTYGQDGDSAQVVGATSFSVAQSTLFTSQI